MAKEHGNTSKVKTERLVTLYRKYGSVYEVVKHTSLSYMGIRFRLIGAGVIKGKTNRDYRRK